MGTHKLTTEQRILLALFVFAALSVVFIGKMVGKPKLLFGQSLTSIDPNLFPLIILCGLAALSAAFFIWVKRNPDGIEEEKMPTIALVRGAALFGLMTVYALLMEPVGFWISSCFALSTVSWLAGNRSIAQIMGLAVLAPPLLYLAATRLLAVSLPELSAIEFFYARILGG